MSKDIEVIPAGSSEFPTFEFKGWELKGMTIVNTLGVKKLLLRKPKVFIIGKTFKRNGLRPGALIRSIYYDRLLTIKEKIDKNAPGNVTHCTNLYYDGAYYISYYQLKRYYEEV